MSGFGPSLAVGFCWVCGRKFLFDPDEVATAVIDPVVGRPPDPDDEAAVARAKRREVCYRCAKSVSEECADLGVPDPWLGQWGRPDE